MTRPDDVGQAIAIIGMVGRFPGARNLGEFWRNLRGGVDSVRTLDDEELVSLGVDRALLADPGYVKVASQPDDIDKFDATFFGINHREAEILDPQQRLFLESAWEALEDAGYDPEGGNRQVGVFAGATLSTYLLFHLAPNPALVGGLDPLQLLVGNAGDSLATRVSYKLNLKGPSYTVQSACSTSLVAVHNACQSLLNEECDVALGGGGVRGGAGGRGVGDHEPARALLSQRGVGLLAGRPLPSVRRAGAGDPVRRRGGDRGAQAAGGRAGGRRPGAGGDPRLGGEQRRGVEGGIHGAVGGRPGGGDHRGSGGGGGGAGGDLVSRGARYGDAAGRPHRDPGADQGVPRRHGAPAVLPAGVGEDEHRPSGRGGGGGGADQDGAVLGAPRDPAQPALRDSEPGDRLRVEPG